MDLAAEAFAGQPVRKLVAHHDGQESNPGERDGFWPVKARQTRVNLLPTGDHDARGEQDYRYWEPGELPGEH